MMPDRHTPVLSIAIVDDHPLTRFALRALIEQEPGWRVCYECDTPSGFLASLEQEAPDVVIIDLCYAEESGLGLLQHLTAAFPQVRTLIYSACREDEYAQRCFGFGACGYVCKEDSVRNVQEAIRCVNRGFSYVSEGLTNSLIDAFANRRLPAVGRADQSHRPMRDAS